MIADIISENIKPMSCFMSGFVLVGDSHVRSYVAVRICAAGKVNNFTSYGRFFNNSRIFARQRRWCVCFCVGVQLLVGFRVRNRAIWWVVGEPDVRN